MEREQAARQARVAPRDSMRDWMLAREPELESALPLRVELAESKPERAASWPQALGEHLPKLPVRQPQRTQLQGMAAKELWPGPIERARAEASSARPWPVARQARSKQGPSFWLRTLAARPFFAGRRCHDPRRSGLKRRSRRCRLWSERAKRQSRRPEW